MGRQLHLCGCRFPAQSYPEFANFCSQRTRVSHKVIEKRRRDRINRCLNELGKTVPMALAKQVTSAPDRVLGAGDLLLPLSA